ncbi:protein NDUFAF4 homolog [Watersipora subatra]|uniref:protein NDUFAF4 homolog n=1 Tax=Watersipora subatra TaxID=2589382 RepID=UPI00355C3571
MTGVMGAALRRPFRVYNVDARAQKVLEKGKKVAKAAPRYPTEAAIEARNKASVLAEDNVMHKKHLELDGRLKQVYVESDGDNPELKSKKKLPVDRSQVVDPEYGYLEPLNPTPGKIPLRLAVEMLNQHKDDPKENSAIAMSDKYNLDLPTTHHILEYFQPYNLRLPSVDYIVEDSLPFFKEQTRKRAQRQLDSAQKAIDEYESKRKIV